MSGIAMCPLCGREPKIILYKPQYEFGGEGREIKTTRCCGVEIDFVDRWNKYAAAMELAKAAVRREVSDYGSANTALSGSNAYVDKFLRVLEVFGK